MPATFIKSTSDQNTSFTSILKNKITHETSNRPDEGWIHFLQDHFFLLRAHSTYVPITESLMIRYQYRIRDFLEENHSSAQFEQAFRAANRLDNDMEFTSALSGVYVPERTYVDSLRRLYTTNVAKQKKL